MWARHSLKASQPRSRRSARYGIVPPRWHGAQVVGGFVDRPELGLVETRAVDIAEQHRARQTEDATGALQFFHRGDGVVDRQCSERGEAAALGADHLGESI